MKSADFLAAAGFADQADRYQAFARAYDAAGQDEDARDAREIAEAWRHLELFALLGDGA